MCLRKQFSPLARSSIVTTSEGGGKERGRDVAAERAAHFTRSHVRVSPDDSKGNDCTEQ